MNATTATFQTGLRPDLSLKRRSFLRPLENDSTNPFDGDSSDSRSPSSLQSAWDKLYRARSILEAEQAHLRDDRIAFQGEVDALAAKERAMAVREQRIRQLEMELQLARAEAEERDSKSTLAKLTRAPFEMARSVFGKKD